MTRVKMTTFNTPFLLLHATDGTKLPVAREEKPLREKKPVIEKT